MTTDGDAGLGNRGQPGLYVRTLRGLLAPRRAVPVGMVCLTLFVAQSALGSPPAAGPVAALMCLTFLLSGPYLWRRLQPAGQSVFAGSLRVLAYASAGAALTRIMSVTLPDLLGLGKTVLVGQYTGHIAVALFWAGGWGLGRDLDYEDTLVRTRMRAMAMEREAQRAQLLAVRSHLDPHFLFNTLNAIAEWCRMDGAVAEEAILKLSAMLRTVLSGVPLACWSLRKELELADALLDLHLVRDPNLFDVERALHVDPSGQHVPPLILLPLIENAVKHGPAAGKRGAIRIEVAEQNGTLVIQIENPGSFQGLRSGGLGFTTVQKRLESAYDGAASMTIAAVGEGTRVVVRLPSGSLPVLEA